MNLKDFAKELFLKGIEAVLPSNLINESVSIQDSVLKIKKQFINLKNFENLYVFGSGKASVEMAKAVENLLFNHIKDGLVVCNYTENLRKIEVMEGSHPVPDEKSLKAGEALLEKMSSLSENDFFIYLLSGGSSALIEKPIPPITLEDLQKTTKILLEHSVPIEDINAVRKHISLIKGGRLGTSTKASGMVLVISDVVGDDLETIGSAPLYFDRTTYQDVFKILEKYNLFDKLPENVKKVLKDGLEGKIPDTPKSPNPKIKHFIIGNNLKALKRIQEEAQNSGFKTHILTSQIKGEAREIAKAIVSIGKESLSSNNPEKPPACFLFGGETTVNVVGNGKGGRNQELCLAGLNEIKETKNIILLSGGTDGIDGNSDAAGAVVDYESYLKSKGLGLDINQYLKNNDSYHFFKKTGDLIITGKTGTNVMDVIILLVGG